jgi:hypothetical protein
MMNTSSNSQLNPDDHITFRIKRKGKFAHGPPFFHAILSGWGAWKRGALPAYEASPPAWLHALLAFPSPCFCLPVAIRVQKHAGLVRITTRSMWWLGDPVGKARGMHGEAETFQVSAFRRSLDSFDGTRTCSFGKRGGCR